MPLPDWFWDPDPKPPHAPVYVVDESKPKLDTKQAIIAAFLADQGNRSKLAASMVAPIRARLQGQGWARRSWTVQQLLTDGVLPIYDKEPGGRTHSADE